MPDRPSMVVSFCWTIIEIICKIILADRNTPMDTNWKALKLISEAMECLSLGTNGDAGANAKLQSAAKPR